jgi:succinate-acetate transporter protein
MSDKQLVVELLNRLPADVKLQDIGREIEFLAAISSAFVWAMFIYGIGTIFLTICTHVKSSVVLANFAFYFLLLGVANLKSMVTNTKGLLELQIEFRKQQKEFERQNK